MVQGKETRQDRRVVCKVFLRYVSGYTPCADGTARTCTSLTTSYSSASASRSMVVLLRMLLKSEGGNGLCERMRVRNAGYDSPTQVVFAILGFSQLCLECFETVLARLEEADALHVRHAVALLVVDLVREVYLVGEEC